MADWAGKLHGAILRIAGILHIINQLVFAALTPIPGKTMKDAITIGYYFLEHAKAAYQLMGADEQLQGARYILRKLESQSGRELAKYEIFRMCRGKYKSVEDIVPSLELLTEYGYIKEQPSEALPGGRPKDNRYILNPKHFG